MLNSTSLNTSSGVILSYLDGSRDLIQNCTKCVVDVQDVALAHIKAYEIGVTNPKLVYGKRYLLVGGCPKWSEITEIIQSWATSINKPHLPIPSRVDLKIPPSGLGADAPNKTLYDCARAENILGIRFTSVEKMVNNTCVSLLRLGYLDDVKEMGGGGDGIGRMVLLGVGVLVGLVSLY